MTLRILRSLDEECWRHFVESQPAGNAFHTPEMFHVFARAKGHQPTLWAATDDGGQVLALLLPVQHTLIDGWLRRLTTRAVVYGSVLHAPGPKGQEALALLLRTYRQEVSGTALFTELRNLSNMEAGQPILGEHGFVYEEHLNYLIDLKRPPEAILQSIGRRTRKNIRRGLRRGKVVVEEAKEREEMAVCYDLLRQTYQAAQVPLADRSLFEAAFALLYPKGMVRFTLARVGQSPAAASVELLYKDVIYGWYGAVDRTYSSYVPNELLMWHILQWGAENGYRLYDFGGAGKPDEEYGVRDFKAKFGGDLVCYGRNIYVHTPALLQLSQWAYEAYRRFL
jgi:lipid II:glycine glycyltransferase (peptidoglycan interpeptide bridge formation enzyme)